MRPLHGLLRHSIIKLFFIGKLLVRDSFHSGYPSRWPNTGSRRTHPGLSFVLSPSHGKFVVIFLNQLLRMRPLPWALTLSRVPAGIQRSQVRVNYRSVFPFDTGWSRSCCGGYLVKFAEFVLVDRKF